MPADALWPANSALRADIAAASGDHVWCGSRSLPFRTQPPMNSSADRATTADTIVVVPCYNEAKRLDLPAFEDFLSRSADVALLLVDDGSSDDTPRVIEQLRERHLRQVMTLRLSSNAGKAEAVRRGV